MDRLDDDTVIERVLRWATIERGTAGLSDAIGAHVVVPAAPALFTPVGAAVAGKVQLFRRVRPAAGARSPSSFQTLRGTVRSGAIVLVHCDASIGAGFGSNIVLEAAACRAQAIVTDGAWRDSSRIAAVGIPAGAAASVPTRPAGCPVVASEHEEMFGVGWDNGDWFLRDADGVLRLDPETARHAANEVAASAMGELASLIEPGAV